MAKKKTDDEGGEPQQQTIPGTAPERIPKLDKLAGKYTGALYERMAIQNKENEYRELLMHEMKEHAVNYYEYNGYELRLEHKDKISCKKKQADED